MLPEHLPSLQVVLPRKERDYRRDTASGGSDEPFCTVTRKLRQNLASSVEDVRSHFKKSFERHGDIPAVAKVELRQQATAKSHRPTTLFNDTTCPIIGGDVAGELFVGVTDRGLDRLKNDIERGSTKELVVNISTLSAIVPFDKSDVLDHIDPGALAREAAKTHAPVRLRLFRHSSDTINATIDLAAAEIAHRRKVESLEKLDYGEGVSVYAVHGASRQALNEMAEFAGTQSLTLFPEYALVHNAARLIGVADDSRFPAPLPPEQCGVVGMIDSGTDKRNKRLQAHVLDRYEWIKAGDQNNEHGSFVGGLLANARSLNHGSELFPSVSSRIVDVVAIGKSGGLSEYDFLTVVEDALKRFPNVRVWNLSLAQSSGPCKDGRFSLLALKLDSLARKHRVLFVIAAGNYSGKPGRRWPPTIDVGEQDRICPPADSIRGITVGSMAHLDNESTCVKAGEPSPFTRRGPAAHFYMKPEVSHFGGNCDSGLSSVQTGVVSIAGKDQIAESVGTSYATPNISTLAANVFRELSADANLSPTTVKAMLVHSAFVRSGKPDKIDLKYRGVGSPGDLADILLCTQSAATVVFHADLEDRIIYEKQAFPMPKCLQIPDVGLSAEIFMTLAYDPPTDGRYGVEYCRSNVTASLGTIKFDPKEKKDKYTPQVAPAPEGVTKGYETRLAKEGYKWSPLKLYYRKFSEGPINAKWRLHLELLNRSGVRCREPQKVLLLVTIRDPRGKAQVYEEMVREMTRLAWAPQDLRIQSRVRGRT